jgi:membrane fusion protein (multidrug efflux system)
MIVLMTIAYLGCVVVAFKVIKIKPRPVSIAVAVLVGVFMLGGIVIAWQQAAPTSQQMTLTRHVLQVAPDVREFVSKVYVKPDQRVSKGEPLFEILPDRFRDAVDQAMAQLTAAKATVSQAEAAVTVAEAAVKKSEADTAAAKAELDTALAIKESQAAAIAKLKVEEAKQGYRAAQADGDVKKATMKQSRFSLAAAQHSVNVAQAALKTAQFNLEQCTYRSPVDGQVVNWQISEGVPVARWRFTANGTVMDFAHTSVLAVFPQNLLKNVTAGDKVEIAFKRRPGKIATGKVAAVVKYTGEGQMVPSPLLPSAASIGSKGSLVVQIRLDDEKLAKRLPLGAAGTTAIYTDFGKPFHVITKITVRMKSWMYYLPL